MLKQVLTLDLRGGYVTLIVGPVILVFRSLKLWKLSAVNSKHLVSKFSGHIVNELLDSALFNTISVVRSSIKALESESNDTIFLVFNTFLAIFEAFKVIFTLHEFLEQLLLPSLYDVDISLLDVCQTWVLQLLRVGINVDCIEPISLSPSFELIFLFLPYGVVLGLFHEVLGNIVVFELYVLKVLGF